MPLADAEADTYRVTLPLVISEALQQPVGARWIRAALQINPYHYHGVNPPSVAFVDEEQYNAAIVSACQSNGIELVAVADHWCFDSSIGLIHAANAGGITALPGFEARSSEGVHLLVLFEANTSQDHVNAAIGVCGVNPGCTAGTPGEPYAEIMKRMSERDALVVPAHVNAAPSGMFVIAGGVPLQNMVHHESLHAVAVSPGVPEAKNQAAILNGTPPFTRRHPLSEVHADDVSDPGRLNDAGATTWFKMSKPGLAGLRIAVRIPETRVRTDDPQTQSHHPIVSAIGWQGGFLDGVRLRLCDSLTALIGGRGTGKSTVVESIRYALGVRPIGSKAMADHDDLVNKVLRTGTTVSVLIQATRPAPGTFVVERTVPNLPIVRDAAGHVTGQTPADVLGAIEIFSQHELAELAEDKTYVARMLQRFVGADDDADRRRDVAALLAANRKELLRVAAELADVEEALDELPRLHAAIKQFQAAKLDARLQDQQLLQREERLLDTAEARVADLSDVTQSLRDQDLLDATFLSPTALGGLPRGELLNRAQGVLDQLSAAVDRALSTIDVARETAAKEVVRIRDDWLEATRSTREQYEEVLRALHDRGLDGAQYLATVQRVERLGAMAQSADRLRRQRDQLKEQRRQLLAESDALGGRAERRLAAASTAANDAVRGAVVVRPARSTPRARIEQIIKGQVPGQRGQIMAAVNAEGFSPTAFAEACRAGVDAINERLGIRGTQAEALARAGEPLFLELEEQMIEIAADAELNVAPDGRRPQYRKLGELSKGQKATALLLLLLVGTETPLFIDQPEDDLDNRFVYDGVVPRLRALKGNRQVLVSTHNANVPVLGDAELVIVMESGVDRGRVADDGAGSIDEHHVRELAEDLLEGGKDAFDARRYLYGF